MVAITSIVGFVSKIFSSFDYKWLAREMNQNLPLELDFKIEAKNAQRCAEYLKDLIIVSEMLYVCREEV
jgi:aarF domain-containing kinase